MCLGQQTACAVNYAELKVPGALGKEQQGITRIGIQQTVKADQEGKMMLRPLAPHHPVKLRYVLLFPPPPLTPWIWPACGAFLPSFLPFLPVPSKTVPSAQPRGFQALSWCGLKAMWQREEKQTIWKSHGDFSNLSQ